jgi:hypothetical protein
VGHLTLPFLEANLGSTGSVPGASLRALARDGNPCQRLEGLRQTRPAVPVAANLKHLK